MKKVVLVLALLSAMTSCKKEESCNCGIIVSDDVTDYSIDIENDCSGNVKKFYLSPEDWMDAHVGENHCITNTGKW